MQMKRAGMYHSDVMLIDSLRKTRPKDSVINLQRRFSAAGELALNLLTRMVAFLPNVRISVEGFYKTQKIAVCHFYHFQLLFCHNFDFHKKKKKQKDAMKHDYFQEFDFLPPIDVNLKKNDLLAKLS